MQALQHRSQDPGSARLIAGLIDHIRLRSFPQVLSEYLEALCQFDSILCITYKQSFRPIIIHPQDPDQHSPALHRYIEHSYILDPIYTAIQQGVNEGICRQAEVAPEGFETSDYYQDCYKNFDFVDEINLLVNLGQDVCFAVCLGRKSRLGTITRSELNRLQEALPVISALIRQFWLSQAGEYTKLEKAEGAIAQALSSFGQGVLTQREQQIAGLILQGHSSKSIANTLNISAGTVKVHRKNIHARLKTSTQSEIFTLFLAHLKAIDS
ncbi:response regulator transcription factor [Aliamphritea hakodatensis]|uniref:response regulator transcription factor n=1 Tax=Aliamphritea hakodatensis TaxID=2895352 RepID=UPI0022FD8EE9|nr:helix-turn-helix transcriptional regulator [Aliamphritea hakodatensis]